MSRQRPPPDHRQRGQRYDEPPMMIVPPRDWARMIPTIALTIVILA